MNKEKYHEVGVSRSGQGIRLWGPCVVALLLVFSLFPVAPGLAVENNVYPAGKVTWLIPYKAGGGFDLVARGIAPYLSEYLQGGSTGWRGGIVMRNEPAASGRKAYSLLNHAKPDGLTIGAFDIGFISSTFTTDIGFDIADFTYMVRAMKTDRIVVTSKNGFANWAELVKASKIKPLKWGTGAFLQSIQLDSVVLTERMGIPVRYIPWAGGTSESMSALMRGDVQVSMVSADSVKGLLDAGEIRPLVAVSEQSDYPGVPTIRELGHPDLAEKLGTQRFVVGPPRLPNNIKNAFISAFKKAMHDQGFMSYASKLGLEFKPLYGADAEKAFKDVNAYYHNELKPLYIKYAK